jgi:hypothetical protein
MSTTFRSVWQGAAFRADLSVNGLGPHASERVTDPEWRTLLNAAIKSAWRIAAAARPDFQVTFQDFTITSGGSASFAVPAWFFDVIDVVYGPDTAAEYSLGPFAWQNRRSPGGWFPANFGGIYNIGGSSARLMGSSIYIEPSLRAGGTYRLWFCPNPKLIRADLTVALATIAQLPAYVATGTGISHQLAAVANGALSIDGTPVTTGMLVLIQNEPTLGGLTSNNGVYSVSNPGSGGAPYVLSRASTAVTNGNVGTMVQCTGGATNVDLFFETTSLTTVVDSTAWTWTEAFIEPALEQFSELLELTTAIPPMQRDDDLDPKPLVLRAFGADGTGGLAGEMKAYFRQTRTGNAPSKMVDTDARGPRSPWSI